MCAEDLMYLGSMPEAAALVDHSGTPPSAGLRARWTLDRARLAGGSDPDQARRLLHEALDLALQSGDGGLICLARLRLGEIATSFAEGEAYYRATIAAAEGMHDPFLTTWARMGLGYNRAKAGRYDEAIPFLEQAHQDARRLGAQALIAATLGNLGWCYWRLGDLDRAMEAYSGAEKLSAQIGWRDTQHRWQVSIGNIYMDRGDLDRAAGYQQHALELARAVGNDTWVAVALSNLVEISIQKGDLEAARNYNRQALEINRRLRNTASMIYDEAYAAEIDARSQRYGQAETGFRSVIAEASRAAVPNVLWTAHGWLAAAYQENHQAKLAEAEYRSAIDTIDREWSKLGSVDSKTTFLAPNYLIGLFQDYVDFLIQNGQRDHALEMAESSRARVLSQKLERVGALAPNFRIGQLISAARASHTVILSYWLTPRRSSVWVIGAGRLSRFDLPPEQEIAGLVERYGRIITQGGDPLARRDPVVEALYQAVLGPADKLIPPGSDVIIVPDGPLHQLAFGSVVVPGPPPHYWLEDVAVATAPSLRALQPASSHPARTPKLLLIGDPVLVGREYGPLPNVGNEIAAVEQQFPAADRSIFTGAKAVPAVYRQADPGSFTNIHFATHATANRESPLNSAIILSHQGEDYKLYARDVAAVPLNAELVTISACRSAGAKAYSGEGLLGFAWAFMQSGAQNVIATLWDEDDASSVEIMRRLYAEMAAGQTPSRALRTAKLALLHKGGRGRLPYYWGALQVFTRQIAVAQHPLHLARN